MIKHTVIKHSIRTCKMRKRSVMYVLSAVFLLSLCFILVHNAAIKPPPQQIAEVINTNVKTETKKSPTPAIEKPKQEAPVKETAEELAQKPNLVRVKDKVVQLEDQGYVDTIRKPPRNKMPIVKADNKINAVVNANHLPAKNKKLTVDDLQPPDHLDAVKMEQDGHLNRDYKKEIFLGNHEAIEQGSKDDVSDKLQEIFEKVDMDRDKRIGIEELESWILQKVEEHFDEAGDENEQTFKSLDADHDGYITWKEFHLEFLVALGNEQAEAAKHVEDYDVLPLDAEDKERLIRYKFKWAQADEAPQDNKLTLEEFKAFRHPEQSSNMLNKMVQDILDNLDQNSDQEITEEEFVALPPGEMDPKFVESDKLWQEERRREFRNTIDINHDGKLTREELMNYVDPQNPNHAKLEARNLIELGDSNHDGKLSLTEVLDNVDLFLGSKMVNTGKSFHDEF